VLPSLENGASRTNQGVFVLAMLEISIKSTKPAIFVLLTISRSTNPQCGTSVEQFV